MHPRRGLGERAGVRRNTTRRPSRSPAHESGFFQQRQVLDHRLARDGEPRRRSHRHSPARGRGVRRSAGGSDRRARRRRDRPRARPVRHARRASERRAFEVRAVEPRLAHVQDRADPGRLERDLDLRRRVVAVDRHPPERQAARREPLRCTTPTRSPSRIARRANAPPGSAISSTSSPSISGNSSQTDVRCGRELELAFHDQFRCNSWVAASAGRTPVARANVQPCSCNKKPQHRRNHGCPRPGDRRRRHLPAHAPPAPGHAHRHRSTARSAERVCAQLLVIEAEHPDLPITLYLHSPGGEVDAGFAIYDTMQALRCDVATVCLGFAASMAQFLLCGGDAGLAHGARTQSHPHAPTARIGTGIRRRHRNPSRAVHDHAPAHGRAHRATHRSDASSASSSDGERDRWFTPEEALEYGMIDHIIEPPNRAAAC